MKSFAGFAVVVLCLAAPAWAVEREAADEDQEPAESRSWSSRLGYESESTLKSESAAKSFFYLSNEVPWPEKKPLPSDVKPAAVPAPAKSSAKPDEDAEAAPVKSTRAAIPRTQASADTAESETVESSKPALHKTSAETRAAQPPKKSASVKKAGLPNIEELLADVRRAAQPRTSSQQRSRPATTTTGTAAAGAGVQSQGAPAEQQSPQVAADAGPAGPTYSEVIGTVDMDELAKDLASLQTPQEPASPAQKKKLEAEPAAAGMNGWLVSAVISATAGAVVLGVSMVRRMRKPKIRSQNQIDAETRAFFAKLASEKRRSADVNPPAPAPLRREPVRPAAGPPPAIPQPIPDAALEEQRMAEAFVDDPAVEDALTFRQAGPADVADAAEPEHRAYLLPPELNNETYKEVIRQAAEGVPPTGIADRMNLGEGEVRLVLDLARLTHERTAA